MTDMTPNFDVPTDFLTYMRNDKDFYTKHYYPTMSRASDIVDLKKKVQPKHFMPMIKKGVGSYCKKYDMPREIFAKEIVKEILNILSSEELPRIEKGEYKCI